MNGDLHSQFTNQSAANRALILTGCFVGLFWSVQLVVVLLPIGGFSEHPIQSVIAALLALLSLLLIRLPATWIAGATTLLAGVALLCLDAPLAITDFGLTTIWISAGAILPAIVIADFNRARLQTVVSVLTVSATVVISGISMDSPQLDWATAISLITRTAALTGVIFWGSQRLRTGAREADLANRDLAMIQEGTTAAAVRDEELGRARRILHDTVINTLASVRFAEFADRGAVKEQCEKSLAQINTYNAMTDPTADRLDMIRDIQATANRLRLDMAFEVHGSLNRVPIEVQRACADAVGEALTNVRKHAQATHVNVQIVGSDSLTVDVADDGVGCDLTRVGLRGIEGSILDRAHPEGIEVEVTSAPGVGTAIRLNWEPTERHDPGTAVAEIDNVDPHITTGLREFGYAVLGLVAASIVGALVLLMAEGVTTIGVSAQLVAISLVTAGVLLALVASRGAQHVRTVLLLPLAVSIPLATWIASLAPTGCNASGTLSWTWLIGVIGIFTVGALTDRVWLLVVTWLLFAATTTAIVITQSQSYPACLSTSVLTYRTGVLVFSAVLAFRLLLNAYGKRARIAHAAAETASLNQVRLEQRAAVSAMRVARISSATGDFLNEIATGGISSADPAVSSQANRLERYCRTVISVPDVPSQLEKVLLSICEMSLRSGTVLAFGGIQPTSDPHSATTRALIQVIDRIGDHLPDKSVLTVSTPFDQPHTLRIVIGSDIPEPASVAPVEVSSSRFDSQTVLLLTWPPPI